MKKTSLLISFFLLALCTLPGFAQASGNRIVEVARSDRQWTGVAVAPDGRIFVNYPRWSDEVTFSVGELNSDGSVSPFPNEVLNNWDASLDPGTQLVCVQSVVVDQAGFLWILDPANPQFQGVIPGGPKLLKVDLRLNKVIQTIRFAAPVIEPKSYLNDVRIDTRRNFAYITDSGAGAIVVVDLATGISRRVLNEHPSTKSEDVVLTIEGRPWLRPDGSAPQVHADGIALDPEGDYLYYQALTGRNLYRIETKWLRDKHVGSKQLNSKVEHLAKSGASDGLLYGPDRRVYISALEEDAIKTYSLSGEITIVAQGKEIGWPDSFATGPDGSIFFTTSQIHRGKDVSEPYKIYKLK